MSVTPEPPGLVDQVRVLIVDVDTASPLFTDDQLRTYLSLNGDNVRRAAADALEAIAVSEVLVSKKIRTQDLSTDGPAVSAELRALAKQLRAQADADDDAQAWFGFDVAWPADGRRPPELSGHEVWGL